jgi:hypothetical protein
VFTQLRNTPTLPTYHEGKVLVSEALSNAQGPFEPGEDAITQVRYVPGGFQVLMKAPNRNTRFGQSGGLGTRNLRVEADITFATPTPAGTRSLPYAGVICRSYQSRSDQGRYLFGIDAGGHAFIVRYRTLDSSDLKELARSGPSATIRQTTPNRIQADCLQVNGTSVALVLRVNGTQLLQTIDNDPGLLGILEGGWGIETVSGSEAGFAAIFANLRVTEMLAGS